MCWLHSRYMHAPDLSTVALLPFEIIALIQLPCDGTAVTMAKETEPRFRVAGCTLPSAFYPLKTDCFPLS